MGILTHWGSSRRGVITAYQILYYLATEHNCTIHRDGDNIQYLCVDGENEGIIRTHVLVVTSKD